MSDNINLLKNYILYLLVGFLICMVGISNVFAESYTYEDIGYFTSQSQVQVEVNYTAQPLTISQNQHVQLEQVFSLDIFVNNINLVHDYVYYFEIYLPNTILTRANMAQVIWYGDNDTSGNCTTITTYFSNNYPHVTFKCNGSTNIKSLYIRYYNSSNQYLFDAQQFYWNYTYMRRRVPDSTDNTGEIKDALNQQTQDIINNQNTNTQQIIDSNKVCTDNLINVQNITDDGKYLGSDGSIQTGSTNGISDYIKINNGELKLVSGRSGQAYSCYYNSNKVLISCFLPTNNLEGNLTIPDNAYYLRVSFNKNQQLPVFSLKICENGNQALNDTLKDDDIGDSTKDAADFITDFDTDTFGLTSIITAPLNLIQSLTSSSCTALHLPLPYLNNKYLDLPCMTTIYQTHFGAFFTMYQTITYGIIAYWVIVRIFNQVKDFKNPEHDEIEVVDL